MIELQQKQAEEIEQKKQRREQAKRDLEEMMEAKKKETALRRENQQEINKAKQNGGADGTSVSKIVQNSQNAIASTLCFDLQNSIKRYLIE